MEWQGLFSSTCVSLTLTVSWPFHSNNLLVFCLEKKSKYWTDAFQSTLQKTYALYIKKDNIPIPTLTILIKFLEAKLPPKDQWEDSLRNGAIMVTKAEGNHADKGFQTF